MGDSRPIRARTAATTAVVAAALTLAGCGAGAEQNQNEPYGSFPVTVTNAFVRSQSLAQRSRFIVRVTNAGTKTIPDVAVSIMNPAAGPGAQSFGYLLPQPAAGQAPLASRSRPVWIVMQNPGPCRFSCKNLGPGGAATAYTNTWALGKLAPGRTATFAWTLEAVKAGTWKVQYQVAAGLNGYARAVLAHSSGHRAFRTDTITISARTPKVHVKPDGQVVVSDAAPATH